MLEERGREAGLAEGGEGSRGVVAEDDDGVRQVDLEGCCLEREHAGEGLQADLVTHVLRVRKRADDGFAVDVGPPAEHYAPAVQGSVPGDNDDSGEAGLAGEERRMERARDDRSQRAALVSVLFEHLPDKNGRLRAGVVASIWAERQS